MFQKRLKALRTKKKLTHQDMADFLGISRQAYGLYENGKREPDFHTLQKLADFFNVSTDYLLGRTDEPNNETLAAHRTDDLMADLPPEARKSLEEFIESMKKLYGGKKE
ncbi:helix-turn-helix domain-containing protein [Thermicanus aegyptius]|uniref:helix-turn-helix domain-containing protein n=1 Tax=Thermicanus aegyptius TaxID=94009 RepID=UPI00040EC286|nr:helix-turn-helix transcriptional regulator [Thermicanus aegyptius]